MKTDIIGQDVLIKDLSRIFEIFKASDCELRPHFILTGESGSGKSFTIKTLCDVFELDYLEINAAQITKEGTAGNSISKALSPLLRSGNTPTIVFVDEFDKLFISGNSNSQLASESTTEVQNEFLKILESETTSVYDNYGKYANALLKNTLFVFAGAFNNEPDITLDRLRDFGVKTEFLGRVGLVYNTQPLSLDSLFIILEKNTLLKKYLSLFPEVKSADVINTIKEILTETFTNNTLGARSVNTLIHQYFIKGGKLRNKEVKEITFQKKLSFN